MKTLFRLVAALGLVAGSISPAQSQAPPAAPPPGPSYVMTYFEFAPSAVANAIATMRTYRDASRREPGALTADIYQESGHPHRFIVREIWRDRAAFDAHEMAASTTQFMSTIKAIHFGNPQVGVHIAYWTAPTRTAGANDVFVISHIDVGGMNVPRLKEMLDRLGPASVNDAGLVRYEILDEVPAHPNHFRFFEQWSSEADWATHHTAAHTRAFRESVTPILGTPYDQRLYRLVN